MSNQLLKKAQLENQKRVPLLATSLAHTPFQLIPGFNHSPEDLEKSLIWQEKHTSSFNQFCRLDILIEYSSPKQVSKQLESLKVQSYQNFHVYLVVRENSKYLNEAKSLESEFISLLILKENSSYTKRFKEILSNISGDYFLYLGENIILHPYALFLFAREAGATLPNLIYANEVTYKDNFHKLEQFEIKIAPDCYSLLARNWYGSAFLASKAVLEQKFQELNDEISTEAGFSGV